MKNSPMRHVAIIMDGNGRWAEGRHLPRVEGHRRGAERVIDAMKTAQEFGLEYLTLYTFSTENWKRSPAEVAAIMGLLEEFLDTKREEFFKNDVRLLMTGRMKGLPQRASEKLSALIADTANNRAGTLILALNYGGRAEIADAAARIAEDAKNGKIDPSSIDEKRFARYLYLPDVPDPDLMIRTAGEMRLSNFLLWELSYSEFYSTQTLWPDFDREEFARALETFGHRQRRFGGR